MTCAHQPLMSIEPCENLPQGSQFTLGFFGFARVCRVCGLVYVQREDIDAIARDAKRPAERGIRTRSATPKRDAEGRSAADRMGLPPAEDPRWDDPDDLDEDGSDGGVVDVTPKHPRLEAARRGTK